MYYPHRSRDSVSPVCGIVICITALCAQAGLVEKLVSGKMAKQQFIDQEAGILRKKEEALDRINQLLKAF